MSLRTVPRDLRTTTFTGRQRRSDYGDSLLTPYTPYLLERWNAGCSTAMRLFRALRQQGYAGAMASSRPLPAACGRPRVSLLGHAAHGGPCRTWRSRCPSP